MIGRCLTSPGCGRPGGTSRNVLAMIRNSGKEPRIIEYLPNPQRQPFVNEARRSFRPRRRLSQAVAFRGARATATDRGNSHGRKTARHDSSTAAAVVSRPALGVFERHLTLWVALCIVVGIALGHWLPAPFQAIGRLEVQLE